MLANLITCDVPLASAVRLARAAAHESGHAVAALHFQLPLKEVLIHADGTGRTRYCHYLGPETAECWTITNFAGAAAERDLFPFGGCSDTNDLRAIDNMIQRCGLDWGERRLGALRFDAQLLVARQRERIRAVAAALVEHRRLSCRQIARAANR